MTVKFWKSILSEIFSRKTCIAKIDTRKCRKPEYANNLEKNHRSILSKKEWGPKVYKDKFY